MVWHEKILTSLSCLFLCQTSLICLVLFRVNVELNTCGGNDDGPYGMPSFSIPSILELLFLSFLTLFEPLWFLRPVEIYVQVYLHNLAVQLNR